MKPRAPQPNPQSSLNSIFSQLICNLRLPFLSGGSNFILLGVVEISHTILAETSVTSLCTDPPSPPLTQAICDVLQLNLFTY